MKRLLVLALSSALCGAQAAEIYNNGPVVNGSGLSVLTAPATTFGFGDQTASGNAVADDFVVPAGQTWNVTSIDLFGYQTGSTSFTFQTATWSLLSGDVNTGAVVASGVTAVTNGGLAGYRVTSTTLGDTTRGIYSVGVNIPDLALGAGSYWLRWSLTGSLVSGPWQPPTSDARTGNAAQSITNGAFATLVEAGSLLTVELPFALQGSVSAVPENSSLALMLAGGLAVAGLTRRRRNA